MKKQEEHQRFLNGLARMLQKVLQEKVKPSLMRERDYLDETALDEAVSRVDVWVGRTIRNTKAFDTNLILKKVPNLAFLEMMVLIEYLIQSPMPQPSSRDDQEEMFESLREIMYAYDMETPEKVKPFLEDFDEGYESPTVGENGNGGGVSDRITGTLADNESRE